jgi:hypothetical protein
MNLRTRLSGNLNLNSETGNIYLITSSINRFRIDPSGNIYSYGNFDVSGNIKGKEIFENSTALINKYATITNLNLKQDIINCVSPLSKDASNNITIETLSVSKGGTGSTTLNNNQILIGNGTNPLLQSPNLIWNSTSNGLGIGTTQLFNATTSFQVNNKRLWIDSTPNGSITVLSTDKYGTGTTENYLQMTENGNMTFRIPLNQKYSFKCENKQPLYIDKDSIQVENLFVLESQLVKNLNVSEKATVFDLKVNNNIIAAKVFGSNATSKSLIQFQTKPGANGLYYYNIDLD